MESVSIREARRQLSEIVDAAQQGRSVVITRRGREVARIGPVGLAAGKGLPDLSRFRADIASKGKSLSRTLIATRRQERY